MVVQAKAPLEASITCLTSAVSRRWVVILIFGQPFRRLLPGDFIKGGWAAGFIFGAIMDPFEELQAIADGLWSAEAIYLCAPDNCDGLSKPDDPPIRGAPRAGKGSHSALTT